MEFCINTTVLSRLRVSEFLPFATGDLAVKQSQLPSNVRLQIEALCADDDRGARAVSNLSLMVRSGEILGIAGVSGNGQRELVEVLAGQREATQFSHPLLSAVVKKPEPELSPILEHLIAAGLLFRQGVPPHASYLLPVALELGPCRT